DAKVEALNQLNLIFESGLEIAEHDGILNALKSCLRTANSHVSSAALVTTHSFVELFESNLGGHANAIAVRPVLGALLHTGGVVEKLGEAREKNRDKAQHILVILAGLASKASAGSLSSATRGKETGKGNETPLAVFERLFKENGLGSKVWRVREQCILTLVHIRRRHPTFPIRPFLTPLVEALEDSDGTVRECARHSVIEIFTAPSVADAARADLKREMAKKNVRKGIVEEVLAKVLGGGSSAQSEPIHEAAIPLPLSRSNTQRGTPRAPPIQAAQNERESSPSRPASRATEVPLPGASDSVSAIYIASAKDLEHEFQQMAPFFEASYNGKETEQNWADRERSIVRIRGMLAGDVHVRYRDVFLAGLKSSLEKTLKTLTSLRTTVSSQTCSLYSELAVHLGTSMDAFLDVLLNPLLRMSALTKKITAAQSQASVTALISNTSASPKHWTHFLFEMMQERGIQARAYGIGHVKTYLSVHGAKSKHLIESSGGLDNLDKAIRKALSDTNPAVRDSARDCFWVYDGIWREKARAILDNLDPAGRKKLEAVCPNPDLAKELPLLITKESKKPSVAAAIAANRAKAKQIAASPPTLRHQATSTSHAKNTISSQSTRRSQSPSSSPPHVSPPTPMELSFTTQRSSRTVSSSGPFTSATTSSPASSPPTSPTVDRRKASSSFRRSVSSATRVSPSQGSPTKAPTSPRTPGHAKSSSVPSVVRSASETRPRDLWSSTASDRPQWNARAVSDTLSLSSDPDTSFNLINFSSPPQKFATRGPGGMHLIQPDPAIEEELRATSEQAEFAAAQFLDLSQTDKLTMEDLQPPLPIPVLGSASSPEERKVLVEPSAPFTPVKQIRSTTPSIWKIAQKFENSPVSGKKAVDMFATREKYHQTGWWLKKKTSALPLDSSSHDLQQQIAELQNCISTLEQGIAGIRELKKLIVLCRSHSKAASVDSGLPSPPDTIASGLWEDGKSFDRLIASLVHYLDPQKSELELQYALILLWEMVEAQPAYLDGHEMELFEALFVVRYHKSHTILEATEAIYTEISQRTDPVYGLTTTSACLRQFHIRPPPATASPDQKIKSHAFGLRALSLFAVRLPPEVLEEELPRVKDIILEALVDKNSAVRSGVADFLVACQKVLRDEVRLFGIIGQLTDGQKNFLTYLFEKKGVRAGVDDGGR
ncbi:hypothetical protein SISSUDRAFT_992747, partial [Sistotremastrum suecicum HHB10207 ss-3]